MNRKRLEALLTEYGSLALYTYFGLFFAVLAGFAVAISFGFGVESTGGKLGVLGAAWVATKATQPLRIGATLLLTPAVKALLNKLRRQQAAAPSPGTAEPWQPDAAAPSSTEPVVRADEPPRAP